jgi:hypothetical protein
MSILLYRTEPVHSFNVRDKPAEAHIINKETIFWPPGEGPNVRFHIFLMVLVVLHHPHATHRPSQLAAP